MNPEKISEFFNRMKTNFRFRNYYLSVYDALRILHKRIFDEPSDVAVQSEEHWSSKLEIALEEERGALERCQLEIVVRQSRVSWLEQVQADDLGDRYHWRQGLEALPCWKSKTARHAAKMKMARSRSKLGQSKPKKTKIDVLPQEKAVPDQRTVALVDYSDNEDTYRQVVFISQSE